MTIPTSSDGSPGPRLATRFFVLALGAALLLWVGYLLRSVLNPFLIAALLAYFLNPLVEWMERKGVPRFRSILLLYAAGLVVVVGVLLFFTPRVIQQSYRAVGKVSEFLKEKQDEGMLEVVRERIRSHPRYPDTQKLLETFRREPASYQDLLTKLGEVAVWLGERATRTVKETFAVLSILLLVPLYTFYLLCKVPVLRRHVYDLVPPRHRPQALRIGQQIDLAMAGFFFGRMLICFGKGFFVFIGLWVLGVPYALVIGLLVAVLTLLPVLSLVIGGGLALLLAFMDGAGTGTMIGVGAVFVASEVLDGIAGPIVLGKTASLHPIMIVFALLAFGKLFGLFGVLLAVPLACATKILWTELAIPYWHATWAAASPSDSQGR